MEIDKSFELGGSIITLGSETCEKSGSSGIICLEEEAGLGSSSLSEHSYPGIKTLDSLWTLPCEMWLLMDGV